MKGNAIAPPRLGPAGRIGRFFLDSKLTPLLVEAVKELSKQVKLLSERNARIELKNTRLESTVDDLKSALNKLMLDKEYPPGTNNTDRKSKSH